jgi:hypothetical protein
MLTLVYERVNACRDVSVIMTLRICAQATTADMQRLQDRTDPGVHSAHATL